MSQIEGQATGCDEPITVADALPAASLIICSRNRPQLLLETVQSVLAGQEVPAELVVVDQSDRPHPVLSQLGSLRDCTVSYAWSDAAGVSQARNIGIAAARHDIVVLIDDDMFVAKDWFGIFVRALARAGEDAVVTGRVLPGTAENHGFVPALVVDAGPAEYRGRLWKDVLAGGHMGAYRSALAAVGCFDEALGPGSAFPGAEDNDLGFRLLDAGYRIVYVPEAVIYHRAWRPQREYYTLRWRYGRGKGGFYAKCAARPDRYGLWRARNDIGRRLRLLPHHVLHDQRRALGDILYSLGILSGAMQWFRTQHKTR